MIGGGRRSGRPADGFTVQRDWFGLDRFAPPACLAAAAGELYLLDAVGSTNDFLLGRGGAAFGRRCLWDGWGWRAESRSELEPPAETRPGTVVVSRSQSRGRGRQGRSWQDCGGLHLSLVMPEVPTAVSKALSVWLGLEVVLCLRETCSVDVRLKWPNDLLIRGRKLGGLLLETRGSGQPGPLVAGLGVNLRTRPWEFPAALQGRATSLWQETGRAPAPADVAQAVLQRIAARLDLAATEKMLPDWSALAHLDCLLGRAIRLESGGQEISGRARGIDPDGELVVETDRGEVIRRPAGDVHVQWGEDPWADQNRGDGAPPPAERGTP